MRYILKAIILSLSLSCQTTEQPEPPKPDTYQGCPDIELSIPGLKREVYRYCKPLCPMMAIYTGNNSFFVVCDTKDWMNKLDEV